ncbi:hypothetical protein [Pedobacter sp. ASV28]|uniref:hypothetical protein n=1 Tax=Pedobacter sp. ASV28 TaxID=2795123 RepID=UPI0018ECD1BF|nr:hypothetical protein [Pedobacter sp. ASV28]
MNSIFKFIRDLSMLGRGMFVLPVSFMISTVFCKLNGIVVDPDFSSGGAESPTSVTDIMLAWLF